MNLNDLANLGQIIGAVAVVISLFYVAHQIRQNTNAVRSATAQTFVPAVARRMEVGISWVLGSFAADTAATTTVAPEIRSHCFRGSSPVRE